MDLTRILNDDYDDDLRRRLPPVPIIPDAPQTQLTVLKSEPSKTCPHGLVRYLEPCGRCWEQLQYDAYGWVMDSKHDPVRPVGVLCVHQLEITKCKVCFRRRICEHKKERRLCKACGGSKLCIVCRSRTVLHVGTTCKRCQAKQEGRRTFMGRMSSRDGIVNPSEDDLLVERVTAEIDAEFARMKAERPPLAPGQVRPFYAMAAEEKRRRDMLLKALAEARKQAKAAAEAKAKAEAVEAEAEAAAGAAGVEAVETAAEATEATEESI